MHEVSPDIIIGFVFGAIVGISLIVITIITIQDKYKDRKKKAKAKLVLMSIEAKGYKWASEPWEEGNVYFSVHKVNVQLIGYLPSKEKVYKTDSGIKFIPLGCSQQEETLTSVFIDVLGKIHISADGATSRLAVEDNKMIIPKDYFIIKEFGEAKDYIDFCNALSEYSDEVNISYRYTHSDVRQIQE